MSGPGQGGAVRGELGAVWFGGGWESRQVAATCLFYTPIKGRLCTYMTLSIHWMSLVTIYSREHFLCACDVWLADGEITLGTELKGGGDKPSLSQGPGSPHEKLSLHYSR